MGKIARIMENGIAGIVGSLEFRQHPPSSKDSKVLADSITQKPNLLSFTLREKKNRNYLIIALIGSIIQISFFKLLYPFPDFISDSYSYISTNLYHMDVNLWPIGYSKFIALIHGISESHTFLVACQYLILQISLLYFFFSILYLFPYPVKYVNILFVFLFFNPLFLYLSNCVLSDALFCSLSLILFTQYLWMLYRPHHYQVYFQAFLIATAFTVRYTAIYYPILAALAFLLSKYKFILKFTGIVLPWMLIIPFVIYTQQKNKQVTGTAEFSVFGGWQLANNALYMYDHIEVDSTKLPPRTLALDRLAREYFSKVPPQYRQLEPLPGTFFIKVPNAILKPYLFQQKLPIKDAPSEFLAWGKVSPIYKEYGNYLIKHYPLAFAKYYLWLNTKNYFIPHLEKFGNYNLDMDTVYDAAAEWFKLKDNSVSAIPSQEFQNHLFFFYPPLFMMLNLYFITCFLYLLISRKLSKIKRPILYSIIFSAAFLFINFCFSVFATPVVLRYQVIPIILLFTLCLYFTEMLDSSKSAEKNLVHA